jgi:hypothetical protein
MKFSDLMDDPFFSGAIAILKEGFPFSLGHPINSPSNCTTSRFNEGCCQKSEPREVNSGCMEDLWLDEIADAPLRHIKKRKK